MIEHLAVTLSKARNIAVLTGAGMSTESGIPDFRSSNGIYKTGENVEKLLSRSYFESKPKEFWKSYKDIFNIKLAGSYAPNLGHYFLSDLERMFKKVSIITQNVDGLHQASGSSIVYEAHGNVKAAECVKCRTAYNLDHINSDTVPRCIKDNFILKPSVVLYGDGINYYKQSETAILNCDVLLVLGSSLKVYPIAGLPQIARDNYYKPKDFKMAIINRDKTEFDSIFDYVIHGDIGETLWEISKLFEI